MSVVICSYNGQRTIGQTISGVLRLDYPNYEVIVVDDGSTDQTPTIAAAYPGVRLISVPNGGLSAARNIGMRAAKGEIIAYIDDDAYPDPQWLQYLADAFQRTHHVAIGGPNLPPPGDGPMAECIANAPGGPMHVLLEDAVAEHIPGCNFVVRRAALESIGGFDPVFRAAGDDVDACWRLQTIGSIGFAPAAIVWHHRRNALRAYWKQQKGYGRAEALLEKKWPQRYNPVGHLAWVGRVYGPGVLRTFGKRWRVYHGTWGSALFQSIYEAEPGLLQSCAQIPEWYLIVAALALLSALGFLWCPLFACLPLFIAGVALPLTHAVAGALRAQFPSQPARPLARLRLTAITTLLFTVQPVARLWGRIEYGLTPWRRKSSAAVTMPRVQERKLWSQRWRCAEEWLEKFETAIMETAFARRGGDFDDWDLQIRGGLAGCARIQLALEEHGAGQQLLRWRIQPVVGRCATLLALGFVLLAFVAAKDGGLAAACVSAVLAFVLALWVYRDCSTAAGAAIHALEQLQGNSR
jgi:glycosyltransferase involved in cell wall biosynthesis